MSIKKLIFCSQRVNSSEIRRETRRGVEHIIIPSYTLPPDIVMNGGLYPTDEVEKSYKSLNKTPVTVEHPEIDGVYVSANDPEIDFDYRFGAFNENARRIEDGRIAVDKVINVQKAMKTERGKRLLDRIEELENSSNPRPIHTSVGVFVDVEDLGSPMTNDHGQEYRWIARNMVFDHDAILLDSTGAATPEHGTGIGINSEQLKVEFVCCDEGEQVKNMMINAHSDLSFDEISNILYKKINENAGDGEYFCITEVYDGYFIYSTSSGELFKSNYSIDESGNIEIQSTRLPVERVVEYKPINQSTLNEGDNMIREKIIEKLKELGLEVNEKQSDNELLEMFTNALTVKHEDSKEDDVKVNSEVLDTIKKQAEQIAELQSKLKANEAAEISEKISTIRACEKYSAISEEALKLIYNSQRDQFNAMYEDAKPAYGLGSTTEFSGSTDSFVINTDIEKLPE